MSRTDICWSPAAMQYVTQIDVGGLDLDDSYADAIFRAIHRPLPVRRGRGNATSSATERDVLRAFVGEITSNEPRLLFVTGQVGTGKSHMVRWLRSQIGDHPKWHIVYVEKRNTSLKRVIESILEGVDTPKAQQLRRALDEASSAITTDEEAIDALLLRLDQLVKFDTATEIKGLPDLDESEVKDLRGKADRLLGDYTFRKALSVTGGPIERIVRLARGGTDPDEAIDEDDLHLRQQDFRVEFSMFRDTGEFENLVKSVIANTGLRTDIAALCDHYLWQAKKEVFTGQATDLLEIFHDVRSEIAGRGHELCLFIEDLVLLHGIDKQLAQALTVPASKDLCKLRAAIAVTEGYLQGVETFTDRGTHFTLDIDTDAISSEGLRDFVSHYLNAGRIEEAKLRRLSADERTPNACEGCPVRRECHETFGKSSSGYGFYPLNEHAVDRLVALASPKSFQPRALLREVIRAPLEVAEYEIPQAGRFPSSDFAKALDENRRELSSEVRAKIRRENRTNPEAEISLRAFYAAAPLVAAPELINAANAFDVELTPSVTLEPDETEPDPTPTTQSPRTRSVDELEQWVNGSGLNARTANKIRRYVCDSVVAELRNGPYGLSIRTPRKNEWKIGAHALRITDVSIERAQGGGMGAEPAAAFVIRATDEDAVVVRGILAAIESGRLDTVDQGRWYFDLHNRVVDFAESIAALAQAPSHSGRDGALLTLTILRNVSQNPGRSLADALPAMLWPTLPPDLNPSVRDFYNETKSLREEALLVLRDGQTAAKGAGKPSILDIGPMMADMRKYLAAKDVNDDLSGKDDESVRILRSLAARQSRASAQIWSAIKPLVAQVQNSLSTDEDLPTVLRNVDKLVDEGQRRTQLPRSDTRAEYLDLRSQIEPDQMTTFRQLAATVQAGPAAANLWDVVHDPRPALNALANYASFTNNLLTEMEANLDTPATSGPGDTRALITELRELADELDYFSAGLE